MSNSTYDRDFYAWSQEQAQLLRSARWGKPISTESPRRRHPCLLLLAKRCPLNA